MNPVQTEVRPWLDHALIAVLALAVGLSFGLSYGLETHSSYLLHPLREIDPAFLQFDWLAAHTELVHKSFALIIRALSTLGPLPWTVAIANVVLVATFILAIYGFLHANFKRDAPVAIALFMFFVVIDRTTSVADTHLLTVRFEPSSIAACAVMIGLLLMITERYAWSGVLIAIAGFVHVNYLLLDFVFFGLAHVALGRQGLARRLILQFAPSLWPLFRELPMLYAMAGDPLAADARHIIAFIRAPHHELPLTSLQDFLPFVGWYLLAMSCIGLETANCGVSSRLMRVYLVCTGVVMVAALLTTVVVVPQISQLRFFRMAPVSIVLAQLIVVTSIGYLLGRGEEGRAAVPWRWAVAALGAAAILAHDVAGGRFLEAGFVVVVLVLVMTMVGGAAGYLGRRLAGTPVPLAIMRSKWLPIAVLSGGLVVSTAPPKYVAGLELAAAAPFYKRYNVLIGDPRPLRELYAFARSTAPESQFLIPPNLKSFRLLAERAVIVDWQTTPWKPFELLEWYRRLRRISGKPDLKSVEEAEAGYAEMDRARLESLEKEFGVDYVVFRKPFDVRRLTGPQVEGPQVEEKVAFMNDSFLVLEVQDEAIARGGT